ncbi:hypothetical protein GcM1_126002, partial [Golovinomyces cichoracearum]
MIPGLLPHFNGTAVKPLPEQESAGKGLGSPLASSNDLTQFKEYQALARTLLRQSCGNDDQRAKIAFLQKPSEMNETSNVVNYAGKNKGRADSRANSKSSSNYHKPLYCTFQRQTIGHIQNDCPDYLKTEPGKKWLRSDAGLAWVKGASKRKIKGHNIRFRGSKGRTTNNDESSDDDNAVLNMVSSLNTGEEYETDDSAYSYFPRKTAFAVPEVTRPHDWYLDTCASRHITPNRDFFIPGSLKPHKISIKCANKSLISSRGIGDV